MTVERTPSQSRMLRRSGIALGLIADCLEWRADVIYQVGVGVDCAEIDVFAEAWPGVRFIGCEPCPDNAKGYPGSLSAVAISDHIGSETFYVKRHHKNGSSLFKLDGMDQCQEITVPVTTLDTLFGRPVGDHVLLWLDCEGSELAAIRGGQEFLEGVEVVNVELTSNGLGQGWCDPVEVHKELVKAGFWLCWQHTQRISSGQCDNIYVRPHLFNEKYCSSPQEIERFREWQQSK